MRLNLFSKHYLNLFQLLPVAMVGDCKRLLWVFSWTKWLSWPGSKKKKKCVESLSGETLYERCRSVPVFTLALLLTKRHWKTNVWIHKYLAKTAQSLSPQINTSQYIRRHRLFHRHKLQGLTFLIIFFGVNSKMFLQKIFILPLHPF